MGKGQSFQLIVLGILDTHIQKNEVRLLPNTIYKNKLKVDQGPKCKTKNNNTLRRKQDKSFMTLDTGLL